MRNILHSRCVDLVVRVPTWLCDSCACADLLVVPAPTPVCLRPLLYGVCHSCVVPAPTPVCLRTPVWLPLILHCL
jgi:hypothetical protein